MYHSEHNEEISFFFTWGKPVCIEGTGAVCSEDTDIGKENWTSEYIHLHFKDGITEIKNGFLEQFGSLKSLTLDKSVRSISMTEELRELLKKNCVTIRGCYNTYAEQFAKENGLPFIHKDIHLGTYHNEEHCESRTLRLHFDDGQMCLLYEDFCQGSSAGNSMGGEFTREMPEEFRRGCTQEEFAYMMPAIFFDQIMKNEELKEFLEVYAAREE